MTFTWEFDLTQATGSLYKTRKQRTIPKRVRPGQCTPRVRLLEWSRIHDRITLCEYGPNRDDL